MSSELLLVSLEQILVSLKLLLVNSEHLLVSEFGSFLWVQSMQATFVRRSNLIIKRNPRSLSEGFHLFILFP
ncbi:hypothetical protein SRABI84_01047 [Peribacillus simplex]|nr:hypothetical protein SRABI84_01047 [Peribacillus simplex]